MNRMRKSALLWSVLLCLACLCACGGEAAEEPAPPIPEEIPEQMPPEVPPEPEDTVYSVYFGEYIVEYTIPADWDSLYTVQMYTGEGGNYQVGFYHKASAEFGGWLFSLALFTDEEYRQFPETTVVAEDGDVTLVCMRPSDVQFDLDYAAEYSAMSEDIDGILAAVKLQRAN